MSSEFATILTLLVLVGALLALGVGKAIAAWIRYRGAMLVTCPETAAPTTVKVDVTTLTGGVLSDSGIRLAACSRWPEKQGCDQLCVAQIAADPDQCLVSTIAHEFFKDKRCAICHHEIVEPALISHPAALRTPDGITIEWPQFPPERLQAAFKTHAPVCWNCHISEEFRRVHPELVTDRPPHSSAIH
jgi:hypothetical protein